MDAIQLVKAWRRFEIWLIWFHEENIMWCWFAVNHGDLGADEHKLIRPSVHKYIFHDSGESVTARSIWSGIYHCNSSMGVTILKLYYHKKKRWCVFFSSFQLGRLDAHVRPGWVSNVVITLENGFWLRDDSGSLCLNSYYRLSPHSRIKQRADCTAAQQGYRCVTAKTEDLLSCITPEL